MEIRQQLPFLAMRGDYGDRAADRSRGRAPPGHFNAEEDNFMRDTSKFPNEPLLKDSIPRQAMNDSSEIKESSLMGESSALRGADLFTGERKKQFQDLQVEHSPRLNRPEPSEKEPTHNIT